MRAFLLVLVLTALWSASALQRKGWIVRTENTSSYSKSAAMLAIANQGGFVTTTEKLERAGIMVADFGSMPPEVETARVESLRNAGLKLEENWVMTSYATPEPFVTPEMIPFGVRMVNAAYAWDAGYTGAGRTVCIIDGGLFYQHEDLVGVDVKNENFQDEWDYSGCDHGTHVAGTISAQRNNNKGVVGVAPGASLLIERVFDTKSCSTSLAAVEAAMQSCVTNNATIINLSLGGGGYNDATQNKINQWYNQGVLIVAAAGNSGSSELSYPASYNNVLSVAAVDEDGNWASFSQYNDYVDVAAPGKYIWSTLPGKGGKNIPSIYDYWSGTSMATPHVAGVAALIWSARPNSPVSVIEDCLRHENATGTWTAKKGWGIVDAQQALDCVIAKN